MYLLRMDEALENDYPGRGPLSRRRRPSPGSCAPTCRAPVAQLHAQPAGRPASRVRSRLARPSAERRSRPISRGSRPSSPRSSTLRNRRAWPVEEIARIPEHAWEGARARAHRRAAAGPFAYPVNAYLQSVKDENHDHPGIGRKATWIAVYRKSYEVWRLDLEPARVRLPERPRARAGRSARRWRTASRGLQGNPGGSDLPLAPRLGRRRDVYAGRAAEALIDPSPAPFAAIIPAP